MRLVTRASVDIIFFKNMFLELYGSFWNSTEKPIIQVESNNRRIIVIIVIIIFIIAIIMVK